MPSHLVGKWALQISPTDPSAADPQLKAFVDEVLSATPDGPVGDDLIDFWRNHWAQKHGIKTKAPSKFETKTEKIQKSREEAMKLIRAHAAEKTSRPYGRRS